MSAFKRLVFWLGIWKHTHIHSALWQNMIDKYKERAEEKVRIINQKEKCKKIL